MGFMRVAAWIVFAGITLLGTGTAWGQAYPNRFLRILTAAPGSANDLVARMIGVELTRSMGQQVIVENRGASLAIEAAAKLPPDGYGLLFYGSAVWTSPFMRDNLPWDPVRDFAPVVICVNSPNVLVVHPSLPVKTVRELIALAKSRPGQLNYAAGTIGASPHLSAELFKSMTRVNIVRVNYKGTGPSVTALLGGEVHLMFAGSGSVITHIKSGRLRALGVAAMEPSALVPGVPTITASGVPGYESASMMGMWVPARTPDTIVHRLNQEIVQGLNRPEVKERLFVSGIEVVGGSPEQFAARIDREMAKWGKLIREAGLRD